MKRMAGWDERSLLSVSWRFEGVAECRVPFLVFAETTQAWADLPLFPQRP